MGRCGGQKERIFQSTPSGRPKLGSSMASDDFLVRPRTTSDRSRRISFRFACNHHPTTRAIAASLKLCFDEQLDWTLDDRIRNWLYVRRVLDGDFPPDRVEFDSLSDYDADEKWMVLIGIKSEVRTLLFPSPPLPIMKP